MDEMNLETEATSPWVLVAKGTGWSVRSFEAGWTVRIRGSDLLVPDILEFVPIWDEGRQGTREHLLNNAVTQEQAARITECFDADWSGSE